MLKCTVLNQTTASNRLPDNDDEKAKSPFHSKTSESIYFYLYLEDGSRIKLPLTDVKFVIRDLMIPASDRSSADSSSRDITFLQAGVCEQTHIVRGIFEKKTKSLSISFSRLGIYFTD